MAEKKPNGVVVPKRATAGGISKMDAVRKSLAELGSDALPVQIQKFIKGRFGLAISTDVISTYKADIRRKAREAGLIVAPAAPQSLPKQTAVLKAPAASQAKRVAADKGHTDGVPLHDIERVKALIGRIGADHLKILVEILDK